MTFTERQVDKFTTALFNRWVFAAVVLITGLGFTTDQIYNLAVATIQQCVFTGL